MGSKLNPKHVRFIKNLLKGMGYGEAYREAGYNPKDIYSACSSAYNLLKKPEIAEEYERRQAQQDQHDRKLVRTKRTRALVQLFNLVEYGDDKQKPRLGAINLVLKLDGFVPEEKHKHEHSGSVEHQITGIEKIWLEVIRKKNGDSTD